MSLARAVRCGTTRKGISLWRNDSRSARKRRCPSRPHLAEDPGGLRARGDPSQRERAFEQLSNSHRQCNQMDDQPYLVCLHIIYLVAQRVAEAV